MGRFLFRLCAVIGALMLILIVVAAGGIAWVSLSKPGIADGTLLTLEISDTLPDAPQKTGVFDLLSGSKTTLADTLNALEGAGNDPRVKGLLLRIEDGDISLAQAQELRDALAAFRAKGKPVIAVADSFGEFGSGTRGYYLVSGSDEIWLQPMGLLGLVGLRAEEPFFRGTLDKLGIVPRFDHREEYKTAMNMLTETKMTPAHREETQAILDSAYGQIVSGIAADRKLDESRVRDLVDHGPLLAQEAVDDHLIDHIGTAAEALEALKTRAGSNTKLLTLTHYLGRAGAPHRQGPVVALIYADGLMIRGKSDSSALLGNGVMGAESVVHAFHLAQADKDVRAILFRIDSPGGSAIAAETVWNAVKEARAAGKPVIVSMGSVAGSGGYYIAAGADAIVAEPATLTGSIGVVAGKFVLSGLMDKLGISSDAAQTSDSAAILSPLDDFTPQGYARFEVVLDDIYAGFKSRVAEGRKMDAAAVENAAKGRVWTGADAQKLGLVDALGGYATALALAKAKAGIPASQDIDLKTYPAPSSGIATLVKNALGRNDDEADVLSGNLGVVGTLLQDLQLLAAPPGALVMSPIEIR
jgi:protease-4